MLVGFMIGGAVLGTVHRLGLRGRIPHYGLTETTPTMRLIALAFLALFVGLYASTIMGFAVMLLCSLGAWKFAQIVVDAALEVI